MRPVGVRQSIRISQSRRGLPNHKLDSVCLAPHSEVVIDAGKTLHPSSKKKRRLRRGARSRIGAPVAHREMQVSRAVRRVLRAGFRRDEPPGRIRCRRCWRSCGRLIYLAFGKIFMPAGKENQFAKGNPLACSVALEQDSDGGRFCFSPPPQGNANYGFCPLEPFLPFPSRSS
jgi:hypothetical protein